MNRREYIKTLGFRAMGVMSLPQAFTLNLKEVLTSILDDPIETELIRKANDDIIKYRKNHFSLIIKENNRPIAGKEIEILQTGHKFEWGCSGILLPENLIEGIEYETYLDNFSRLFNATTARCYWDERWHQPIEKYEGERIYQLFDEEINAGFNRGLKVKGHPLVWTVPKAIPDWLLKYSYPERIKIWKKHVQDLVRFAGNRVQLWDVVNEMLWEPTFKDIDERKWPQIEPINDIADYIATSIGWAREISPNARMSLNDYGLIQDNNSGISAKSQQIRYLQLVDALRSRAMVPDAIGIQSHVGNWYKPSEIKEMMDTLSQSRLPLQITEFWSHWRDRKITGESYTEKEKVELTIEYLRIFYTMAFSHPSVEHITYWGNPFFDNMGNKTAIYDALFDLIWNKWSTSMKGITDDSGRVNFSGFKGYYVIKHHNKIIKKLWLTDQKEPINIDHSSID